MADLRPVTRALVPEVEPDTGGSRSHPGPALAATVVSDGAASTGDEPTPRMPTAERRPARWVLI